MMIIYKDTGHYPESVLEKMVECLHASITGHLGGKRAANSADFFCIVNLNFQVLNKYEVHSTE